MILVNISHHFLSKSKKHNIFAIFEWSGIFRRNRALSLCSLYQVVTSCQKLEKSLEPFSRKRPKYLPTYLPNYPTILAWAHLLEVRTVTSYRTWLTSMSLIIPTKLDLNILKNLKKLKKSKIVWFIKFYQLNKFNRYD